MVRPGEPAVELLDLAERWCPCLRHAAQVAELLPADDEELDRLVAAAVEQGRAEALTLVVLGAASVGRTVNARCLVAGVELLPSYDAVALAFDRARGEVAEALVAGLDDGLPRQRELRCLMLYLAARWCERAGAEPPRRLLQRARMVSREIHSPASARWLRAAARLLADAGLDEAVAPLEMTAPDVIVDRSTALLDEVMANGVSSLLPPDSAASVLTGYTVRRATDRVGRNEPCPCGSGKKYKRCCAEADRDRLRDSSEVEGVTRSELKQRVELLTPDRLWSMRRHELERLDPMRVPEAMRGVFVNHAIAVGAIDTVLRFLTAVGPPDELVDHLYDAIHAAVEAGRRDLACAFLELGGDRLDLDDVPLPAQLWSLKLSTPGLALLEQAARRHLDSPHIDLATELLMSDVPALGILVARGATLVADPYERDFLLEDLLQTRDRLEFEPHDPVEEVLELLESAERSTESTVVVVEELVAERRELARRSEEIEALRRQVGRLRGELSEHERAASRRSRQQVDEPTVAAPPAAAAIDEAQLAELRQRVASLRQQLVERHEERNQLRRELRRLTAAGGSDAAPTADGRPGAVREDPPERRARPDEDGLDDDAGWDEVESVVRGLHVPTFAPGFAAALRRLPERTARAALELVGELAAGKPSAYVGMKRLKGRRVLCRQKVGRSYRLLFLLDDDRFHVLALVHRQDLETTLRTVDAS